MLRAVVFDFDGVVVETEEPEFVAWREVWAEHDVDLPLEEWVRCIGTVGAFDPAGELVARAPGPVDLPAVRRRLRSTYQRLIADTGELPGVRELLDECREAGVAVAIASSASRGWVEEQLGRLGLLDLFPVLSCYDGTCPAKPAPDLYLRAVRSLGVPAASAVAIEDSPNGVRAAKAAGLRCVAVPGPLTRHLDLTAADRRAGSLAEVRLGDLAALVERG